MLSDRIVYLRKRNGLSQAQLAKLLNISPSAAGMYEQGRRMPAIDILVGMSKVFCVSLDYLITGAEYAPMEEDHVNQIAEACPCSTCYWKQYKLP